MHLDQATSAEIRNVPAQTTRSFQQLRFVGFDFDIGFVLQFGRGKRGRMQRRGQLSNPSFYSEGAETPQEASNLPITAHCHTPRPSHRISRRTPQSKRYGMLQSKLNGGQASGMWNAPLADHSPFRAGMQLGMYEICKTFLLVFFRRDLQESETLHSSLFSEK